MTDLIQKLESAESGSRELSDEVLIQLGYTVRDKPISDVYADPYAKELVDPSGEVCGWFDENRPSPTESVDDALGLTPPMLRVEARLFENGHDSAYVELIRRARYLDGHGEGKTLALALSAAILRAQQKE